MSNSTPPATGSSASGLDAWAGQHAWHPRVGPWFVYMIFLTVALYARDWQAAAYVPAKIVQTVAVCYLIWRWRRLVPELNWKFHWSVVPVSLFLTGAWIYLNKGTVALLPSLAPSEPGYFEKLDDGTNVALLWTASVAHLVAMCTAVPMIEETFNRSLLLRSLSSARTTGIGVMQVLCDMPLIGDWLIHTKLGTRATQMEPVFGPQFEHTPLGALSVFGVAASSAVFALVHTMADWPGAIVCGVTWCIMLNRTRHLGLGPVIWSHAMVNLLLWGHVMYHREWQFM